jgi:hypothetical protein
VTFLVSPNTKVARLVERAGFIVNEIAWDADASAATRALHFQRYRR